MLNDTDNNVSQTNLVNYLPRVDHSTQLFFFKILPSIVLWFFTPTWIFMLRRKTYPFKFKKSWNLISKIVFI